MVLKGLLSLSEVFRNAAFLLRSFLFYFVLFTFFILRNVNGFEGPLVVLSEVVGNEMHFAVCEKPRRRSD